MNMNMTKFEVGKPFPLAVPRQEGVFLELWEDGLTLIIQFPGLSGQEKKAFDKGVKRYSYLESHTDPPLAVWVFEFAKPFNAVDCNFDAKKVKPKYVQTFLEPEEGEVKNALQIYLLDGNILQGMRLVGLQPDAVKLFQETISKQMSRDYSAVDSSRALREVHQYSTEQLFHMGLVF